MSQRATLQGIAEGAVAVPRATAARQGQARNRATKRNWPAGRAATWRVSGVGSMRPGPPAATVRYDTTNAGGAAAGGLQALCKEWRPADESK